MEPIVREMGADPVAPLKPPTRSPCAAGRFRCIKGQYRTIQASTRRLMTKPIVRDPIYRRRRFDAEIIELCLRWYITYRLSYRDLAAMMAERGISCRTLRFIVG